MVTYRQTIKPSYVVTAAVQQVTIVYQHCPSRRSCRHTDTPGNHDSGDPAGGGKVFHGDIGWELENDIGTVDLVAFSGLSHLKACHLHEEDGNDEEVSIALKVESLDERVPGFVIIECSRISQIGSIEVIQQVAGGEYESQINGSLRLT